MNIQTERLEDQTARFTVEVDPERLEKAKRKAARHIAKRVNIPGFRKGKVPYNILVQNGLESQITMDAIEELSQEIYRETLDQSDIDPYGPGSFEDYKMEPNPTFIYTVPLQPSVQLNDYISIRAEYIEPEVSDDQVEDALKRLQRQEALVEESSEPVALGNQVTLDIHSEFADEPPEVDDDDDEDAPEPPPQGMQFIHEHDAQIVLDPDDEPVLEGFNEALVGATVGEKREFELTIPENDEDYDDIAGRKIHFEVTVQKIETITLPALNDDFAARVTPEDEEEPLTLLGLRMRLRENIQKSLEERMRESYANEVLSQMIEEADIAYPEAMVEDQIDSMIEDFDKRLKEQGLTLDTYTQVTGMTQEDIRAQYRETAEATIERSLVLREIVKQEDMQVPEERMQERLDTMLSQFGEQAESLRSMFDTPDMRSAIENDILQAMVMERVVAIGRGEESAPAPESEEQPEEEDTNE